MLAPHHREDAEFGIGRFAAEDALDALVFFGRQAMLLDQFRRDRVVCHRQADRYAAFATFCSCQAMILSKIDLPSAQPKIASLARSGCGIRPATFLRSLQMPAMFSSEPFGLASSTGS